MNLSKDGKRTLFAEASKFCLDIAKLVIGGVLLASIMKEDIDKITLYMMGVLIVLFFTFLGVFLFLGVIALFMSLFALWGVYDLRKNA